MIKKYNIETIRSIINIVDLATRLGLSPNSHDFIKSVFKEEKTPSLKLYKNSGTFHCFSTGVSGNIFDLYSVVQGLDVKSDFKRVLEELSTLYSIYQSDIEIVVKKPKLLKPNSRVDVDNDLIDGSTFDEVYRYFVSLCNLGGLGVDYLKGRGFDISLLKQKSIGYVSDNSYLELSNKLQVKFDIQILKESGLFNEAGKFKGYSNSIVIPYFNIDGKISNLQFRLLGDNSKQFKYLYLKHIKKIAYGLDTALKTEKKESDSIYFTEGVFDTLILQQLEFNSIAIPSAGDSKVLTDQELLKIIGCYNKLILAFDNDDAGLNLQKEFGNRLFKLGAKNILVKLFPKGVKDVNDFVLYLDKNENIKH